MSIHSVNAYNNNNVLKEEIPVTGNIVSINGQALFNTFTEFQVKYAGLIPEIPLEADPTCRTEVLRILDEGKRNGQIPKTVDQTHNAILGLNAYSIRILSEANKELLLQVPIHMLAAVSLIKEDNLNILGIKIGEVGGNKELNDLAVVYCDSPKEAEDICTLFGHCFQLIFFEATTQTMVEGATVGFMPGSGSVASSAPIGRAFLTRSVCDQSDRTSANAMDLIQEYLRVHNALLNPEELKQFAMLLKRWRDDNLPLLEFCQKVLELYGSERKHLLAKMRSFIPDSDMQIFNSFLEQSGVSDNAECSLPSWSPAGSYEGVSLGKPSDSLDASLPPSLVSTVSPADASGYAKALNRISPGASRRFSQQQQNTANTGNNNAMSISLSSSKLAAEGSLLEDMKYLSLKRDATNKSPVKFI